MGIGVFPGNICISMLFHYYKLDIKRIGYYYKGLDGLCRLCVVSFYNLDDNNFRYNDIRAGLIEILQKRDFQNGKRNY